MLVIICIEDLKCIYECCVLCMFYDYVESGSYIEQIFCENILDFVDIYFKQCVVIDMIGCSIVMQMIGQDVLMFVVLVFVGLMGM